MFLESTTDVVTSNGLSRRELLAATVAAGLAACTRPRTSGDTAEQEIPIGKELHYGSTRALAQAIRTRHVSSEDVVRACIERIQAVNARLNAVVQFTADAALAAARDADAALARGEIRGPLHGVPMTIKDSLDTAGIVTTGGTKGRAAFVPSADAPVVARLKRAGAILLGKTNTPELTLSFNTTNLIYGPTRNPYDLMRSPGGSSGGAAAIVAAGGVPFDIGSDYAGSIRVPSHFCGVAGIKPTSGRVPRTGHILPYGGLLDSFQQIGPIARTVDDLALILPLIAGPDFVDPAILPLPAISPDAVALKSLRVAFHTDNGIATPTPETADTVRRAAKALADVGAAVTEARPAGIEEMFASVFPFYTADGGAAVRRLLKAAGTTETMLTTFTEARPMTAEGLDALVTKWYDIRSRMTGFLKDHDVIVCPVNAHAAPALGERETLEFLSAFSYTMTYNATGWPAMTVRGGTSPEGLPIGVQVVAHPGREDVALVVGRELERALGGFAPPALGNS
jgi:amidase